MSADLIATKETADILRGFTFVDEIRNPDKAYVVKRYRRDNVWYYLNIPLLNGEEHGLAEMYDQEGRFIASFGVEKSQYTGEYKLCNERGYLLSEGSLQNGFKNGECEDCL